MPLPVAVDHHAHLQRAARGTYPTAMAIMWAVEAACLEAWWSASPGAPAYRQLVEHWTDAAFAAFVAGLESAAGRALAGASVTEVHAAAEPVAVVNAAHEAPFLAMTWSH